MPSLLRQIKWLLGWFAIGFLVTMAGAALDLLRPESVFISWTEFLGNWQVAVLVAVPTAILGAFVSDILHRLRTARRSNEEL